MLQQLAVLVIGMAHGPVGEHAAVTAQVGSLTIKAVMAPWISVSQTTGMPSR